MVAFVRLIVVVGGGELAGGVAGVVGRAVHRVDVLCHTVGGIEVPGIFHEGRLALEVAEIAQSPGLVVAVAAFGHQLCAGQVGVAGQRGQLPGGVVGEVHPLFSHGPAARLGALGDADHAAQRVVGPLVDELGRPVDLRFQLGAAARRVVNLSERHHGC